MPIYTYDEQPSFLTGLLTGLAQKTSQSVDTGVALAKERAAERKQQSQALAEFLAKFTGEDPAKVSNMLRAFESSPEAQAAFTAAFGTPSTKLGSTVPGEMRMVPAPIPGGVAPVVTSKERTLTPGAAPTAEQRQKEATLAQTKAITESTIAANARAAAEFGKLKPGEVATMQANAKNYRETMFVTPPDGGPARRMTMQEANKFIEAQAAGKSWDDSARAAGLDPAAVTMPNELQNKAIDVFNVLRSMGYSDEEATQMSHDAIIKYPMEKERLTTEQLAAAVEVQRAVLENTKLEGALKGKKLEGGATADDYKPDEIRQIGIAFNKAAAEGHTALANATWSGKFTLPGVTGPRGKPVTTNTLPFEARVALIDPLSPAGVQFLQQHKIPLPASADDVGNIRVTLEAISRIYGVSIEDLGKVTLNVKDVTPYGTRSTEQEVTNIDDLASVILSYRTSVMETRRLKERAEPPPPDRTGVSPNAMPPASPTPGGASAPSRATPGAEGAPSPPSAQSSQPSPLEMAIQSRIVAEQEFFKQYAPAIEAYGKRKQSERGGAPPKRALTQLEKLVVGEPVQGER